VKLSLYLDEDSMARSLVAALRARGADVLTVIEAGLRGKDDQVQLQWAATGGDEKESNLYIQRFGLLPASPAIPGKRNRTRRHHRSAPSTLHRQAANSAAFECGQDEIGRRYAEPSALLVKVLEKALPGFAVRE
jgi:hypothetical protein